MIQPRRVGIALAAVALPWGLVLPASAAVARDASSTVSKQVINSSTITIDNLLPGTIPAKGTVVVSGTLHNGSNETWHHLTVMPEMSYLPIESTETLDAAAHYDPANVNLGQQLPNLSTPLSDLAPGRSVRFTVRIPRSGMSIAGGAGAYWLGVVPVSDEQQPTTLTARTFLPLLPKVNKKARVNIALVLPLRTSPLRSTTGALSDPSTFANTIAPEGRLGRIATFGQQAAARPLTWLVDPALLDLVDDAARGTTSYPVGLEGTALPSATPLPTPSGSASAPTTPSTPTGSPSSTTSSSPSATPTGAAAAALAARMTAQTWLGSITSLLQASASTPGAGAYALPYADPAVAPLVATRHTDLLAAAINLSTQSMTARTLQSQPAVAPTSGSLTQKEWSSLAAGQTVFVNSSAGTPRSMVSDTRTLIVASPASDGGPGPTNQTSALNLRQRLLAEASLKIGRATTTNLTVVLPAAWDPGSAAGVASFFPQLTRSWIAFTGLPTLTSGTAKFSRAAPQITTKQRANVKAAVQLSAATTRLASVLATPARANGTLARQLGATVFSTVSYTASGTPVRYRVNAARTVASIDNLLGSVKVEGTQFVTLSGSSGVITVALHNGLNQPIRAGVRQINREPGSPVAVDPVAPITLDPGERSTLRLHLSAHSVSVQEVTLTAVTSQGSPIGTPLTFTVRSSSVGAVVWAITIAIVMVLVFLIMRRIRRRLRARRVTR